MLRFASLCVLAVVSGACFSTDLDADALDAFACGPDADNAPCPDEQTCSVGRCRDSDALPRLTIDGPANGDFVAFSPETGDTFDTILQFSVAGGFDLVDPAASAEHVFGEGHVVVSVDGTELAPITMGTIAGGREIGINIPNIVGVHRISVELRRNDGEPYDHSEAVVRNIFWLSDGTPRVALTRPWPGEQFGPGEEIIEAEVGVIDFEIVNAGAAPVFREGHVHLHYNAPFPECPDRDDGCDGGYFVVIDAPSPSGRFGSPNEGITAKLPEDSMPGDAEVTAILRHVDHPPYRLPDEGDANFSFPPAQGAVVFDTITITRQ